MFVYRKIYALNGFFFLINLIDWSVPWHPESKIIIDIPTAVTFFLEKKEHTKRKVTEMSQKLVRRVERDVRRNQERELSTFLKNE